MMTKPLRVFNLLLAVVALGLAVALANTLFDLGLPIFEPRAVSLEHRPSGGDGRAQASEAEAAPPQLRFAVPPLNEFNAILARDPFKNPFAGSEATSQAQKAPAQLLPLPTLVGTVFIGDEKKAVLREAGRTQVYGVGQPVAGGTLVEIREDRVVLQRGGSNVEVMLKASVEAVPPGQAAQPRRPQPASPPAATPRVQPSPAPTGATEASPAAQQFQQILQGRQQDIREQQRQLREQRRQQKVDRKAPRDVAAPETQSAPATSGSPAQGFPFQLPSRVE
jgi:hypothetical protein